MFLLKQINKQINTNSLYEGKCGEGRCGSMKSEDEEYSTLTNSEISQLVSMIAEYMNSNGYSSAELNYAVDYAYDLVANIPGLEDEQVAQDAVKRIIAAYKQTTR